MNAPNPAGRGGRPYGKLEYVSGKWMMSKVEPHVALRLKSMFASVKKTQTGEFTFPDTEQACADIEWFLHRYPLEMTDGDRERLIERKGLFFQRQSDIERIFLPDYVSPPKLGFKQPFELWGLQSQAIDVLHRMKRLLLGDTMGLGKSFTALGSLVGQPYFPAAYVTKSHLTRQLVRNFVEPHTYLSAHIIEGRTVYDLPPANLYVFSYSNIAWWSEIAATGIFRSFIADEMHELRRGIETEKGEAAKLFADNAELVLAMSGTPVFNYGDEIFNLCEIFVPGVLGSREEFYREWCSRYGNHWIVDDPDALGTYLREIHVFLRREREGRPVNRQIIEVEYDHGAEEASRNLAQMLALKTLNGSFTEAGNAARELDLLMRHDTGVGKARGVAAFTRMLASQKIPVLLFGWHHDVYDIWEKELAEFKPVMHTGRETTRKKERNRRAFMNGETDLAILSLRSGDGVDGFQHRCRTIVFGEYDWTGQVHEQCIGRVDRPGQNADVIDAFYCHANYGSDPTIISVHGIKNSQARGITNPLEGVKQAYRDEARVKLLAKNYLEQQGA